MKRLLQIIGVLLTLMFVVSFEIADLSSWNPFSMNEAEAFRRHRRNLGSEQDSQTASPSTDAEVETEGDETQEPYGRERFRQRDSRKTSEEPGKDSRGSSAKPNSRSEAEPATSGSPIGTVVQTLPADCEPVVAEGIRYSNCGGTYYRAAFQGSNLVYVVVEKP